MYQEKREVTQEDIDKLIQKYAIEGMTNEPVFQYQQAATAKAMNLGYPKEMYHAQLEPRRAYNQQQVKALGEQGYRADQYIFRSWPSMYYRRNMAERFAEGNPTKGEPGDYIEQRKFTSQEALDEAQKQRRPRLVVSAWVKTLAELPELEEGPNEDPQVTIARLQGELAARRTAPAPVAKGKPGRKPKVQEVEFAEVS